MFGLGVIAQDLDDATEAQSRFEVAAAAFRQPEDDSWTAATLYNLGLVVARQGNAAAGTALIEDALVKHRAVGHDRGAALALRFLGLIALGQGDLERAAAGFRESLSLDAGHALGWHIAGSHESRDRRWIVH